jgi:hypothetical protein
LRSRNHLAFGRRHFRAFAQPGAGGSVALWA